MRIEPIDFTESLVRNDAVKPTVLKSRLKRLFDRPFNGVLRISSADKPATDDATVAELEPSSVCLDKMVQNFMEENNEKYSSAVNGVKYVRNRCNCFNGNSNDSSNDDFDLFSDCVAANPPIVDPSDILKSYISCTTTAERNLLADASAILDKNTCCKRKDELRKFVTVGLIALDYNASVCKSKWEKSPSVAAGEYEYIDVMMEGERIIIDVDFRSEFEIARPTSSYKAISQILPYVFVGKSDRLLQIVSLASEAARQSLKKKCMHVAPWRKAEYMKSKWLSPYARITPPEHPSALPRIDVAGDPELQSGTIKENQQVIEVGEWELIFGEKVRKEESKIAKPSSPEKEATPMVTWQLPALKPKSYERRNKVIVTGLASLLKEKL